MSIASRTIGVRSRAQSLVRFGEAHERSVRYLFFSLARAHTPHTPRGVRASDAPVSLVRAHTSERVRARAKNNDRL